MRYEHSTREQFRANHKTNAAQIEQTNLAQKAAIFEHTMIK